MALPFITVRYAQYGIAVCFLLLILGLVGFSLSNDLHAQTRPQDVKPLLQGYEWRLAPQQFMCLGEGVDETLRAVAADETLPYYYRQRALTALRLFPNRQTANYLEQVISSSASHPSHVQRALYAYANAFAGKHPNRVTEVARNALMLSRNDQIKTAAAETLARMRTAGAKQTLRAYLHSGLSKLQRQHIKDMLHQAKSRPPSNYRDQSGAASRKHITCPQHAQ